MYDVIKNVILSGKYELADMLKKIDTIWIQGDITEEEKTELTELARENANTQNSIDVISKLEELDKRVKALEKNKPSEDEPTEEEYPEYVAGKWYYKGDKISFNGKHYECIAPDGAVCTWNPDEYPPYWKEIN